MIAAVSGFSRRSVRTTGRKSVEVTNEVMNSLELFSTEKQVRMPLGLSAAIGQEDGSAPVSALNYCVPVYSKSA